MYTLFPTSKGFIAGGEKGSVIFYEKNDDVNPSAITGNNVLPLQQTAEKGVKMNGELLFKKSREFVMQDEGCKVTNLAMPQSEDICVCTTDKSQIFSVALVNNDNKVNISSEPSSFTKQSIA